MYELMAQSNSKASLLHDITVIGFVLYAIADVEQKARVKQRIIQTMLGIAGIILAISLVNLIIDLFK